jgi:hypothetical protein
METNMMLAIPLLNYWQNRYAHRLLRMTHSPRHILFTRSNFSSTLWDAILPLHELDPIEEAFRPANMTFPGLLLTESNLEDALMMVLAWTEVEDTLWTDGSKLEDGIVGCGVVWKEDGGHWQGKSFYLGRNKEVFDAEPREIYKAMTRFSNEVTLGHHYIVFADA